MLTNVFGPGGYRSPQLCHKLLGVEADLDDVVEQSEERCEREGRHKQSHKAKLDHCRTGRQ